MTIIKTTIRYVLLSDLVRMHIIDTVWLYTYLYLKILQIDVRVVTTEKAKHFLDIPSFPVPILDDSEEWKVNLNFLPILKSLNINAVIMNLYK